MPSDLAVAKPIDPTAAPAGTPTGTPVGRRRILRTQPAPPRRGSLESFTPSHGRKLAQSPPPPAAVDWAAAGRMSAYVPNMGNCPAGYAFVGAAIVEARSQPSRAPSSIHAHAPSRRVGGCRWRRAPESALRVRLWLLSTACPPPLRCAAGGHRDSMEHKRHKAERRVLH